MANVPAIVVIGGRHTHGGIRPNTEFQSTGAYGSGTEGGALAIRDARAMRVVPDDPATGAANAATLGWYPVFDGTAGTPYVVGSATATTVTVTPDPGWDTAANGGLGEWAGNTLRNNNITGLGFANRDIVVVSNTSDTVTVASWTATPTVGTAIWFNEGAFKDTHIIAGWRTAFELADTPTRGGASWQLNNFGVSPVPMLTRELWEKVWTASPYFHVCHYFTQNPVVGNFDDTGAAERAAFLAEKARWDAAWTQLQTDLGTSNTLSWADGYVVLDMSQNDVENDTEASYLADLLEMIAWLRSAAVFNAASLRILLLNHDTTLNNIDHPATQAACNTIHDLVALSDANVYTVSLDGQDLPLRQEDDAVPTWLTTVNQRQYSTGVYVRDYPRAIRRRIEVIEAGTPQDDSGSIPTYLLIGDSLCNSTGFDASFSTENDDILYTGTSRDSREMIWNGATAAIETHNPHDNSATLGTVNGNAGPEYSLLTKLRQRHPVTGALVIKLGAGGSALASTLLAHTPGGGGGQWQESAGEQWDALEDAYQAAAFYANVSMGKQINVQGIFALIGTNDQAVAGGGAAFATALPAFCSGLRSTFSTQVVGKDTPIVWVAPQLGTSSAIGGEPEQIRNALTARAKADPQFELVNVDDLNRASDDLHYPPANTILIGERLDAALSTVALPNC